MTAGATGAARQGSDGGASLTVRHVLVVKGSATEAALALRHVALVLVARPGGEYGPLLPDDPKMDAMLGRVLDRVGGLSLVTDDAGTAPWRLAGVLAQNPLLAVRVVMYLCGHFLSGKMPRSVLAALLKGKVHTFNMGIHNFMDAAKTATADHDPVIKSRLDGCVFKGAVKQNGEWVAVPMCKMNQEMWSSVYEERLRDPALRAESQTQVA